MTIIVSTIICIKKSSRGTAGGLQEAAQCPKPFPPQVAQLLTVGFFNRCIETGEKFESTRRNPGHHHSPVSGFSVPRDQAALLQAVQKTRNVGISCNHAIGNLAAGQAIRRSPKDAEDVVLVGREVFGLENLDQTP